MNNELKPWLGKRWPDSLKALLACWDGDITSLAKKTGVDHKTIKRWLNGSRPKKPRVRLALKLAWGFTDIELPEIDSCILGHRTGGAKGHCYPPGWPTATDKAYIKLHQRAGVAFGVERRQGQVRVSIKDRARGHQEFLDASGIIRKKYKINRWKSENAAYQLLLKYGRMGLSNVERILA